MSTRTALSESEYLRTSFPGHDREFEDGEVIERSMPDWLHSRAQGAFTAFFHQRENSHRLIGAPELRLRIRPGRYLVPDVSVFWPEPPARGIPDTPPLIAIEILSPGDSMSEVRGKLQEYAGWGVPHIWLADPHRKIFYRFKDGIHEVNDLSVDDVSLTVTPGDIFE